MRLRVAATSPKGMLPPAAITPSAEIGARLPRNASAFIGRANFAIQSKCSEGIDCSEDNDCRALPACGRCPTCLFLPGWHIVAVTWGNCHVWQTEQFFDGAKLASVIAFDGMAEKLQGIPPQEKCQYPVPLGDKKDRDSSDRHGNPDQVDPKAEGVLVPFHPVAQPARAKWLGNKPAAGGGNRLHARIIASLGGPGRPATPPATSALPANSRKNEETVLFLLTAAVGNRKIWSVWAWSSDAGTKSARPDLPPMVFVKTVIISPQPPSFATVLDRASAAGRFIVVWKLMGTP